MEEVLNVSDDKFFPVFDQKFGEFMKKATEDTVLYYKKKSPYQVFVMIRDYTSN